jgi:hypothetical protein
MKIADLVKDSEKPRYSLFGKILYEFKRFEMQEVKASEQMNIKLSHFTLL